MTNSDSKDTVETIEALQNTHNNIKVFTAIPMGVLMILYFFSYATLIDHGMYGVLGFEIVTTVVFVMSLIYINRLSFFLLKIRYRNKPPYQDILPYIDSTLLARKAQDVLPVVMNRRHVQS